MSVIQLHQDKPVNDVAASLRRLADEIEAGDHGDWPITTCVVLLGHTDSESRPDEEGWCWQRVHWDTRGYGTRTDNFTVRGLMATALQKWGSE